MKRIDLIVGLGNPGEKYRATRHNAGFWFVERFARGRGATFRDARRVLGTLAEVEWRGRRVRLLEPSTFMNRSGLSVAAAVNYFRLEVPSVLVVHDEIDLPAGTVRLKEGGGHGGHNGLRDIISHLGSNAFARLRIGVGHPGQRDEVIGHVLRRAAGGEQERIDAAIDRALDEMETILEGDLETAMNVLNRRERDGAEGA